MTSKEIVRNTIRFKGASRLPYDFPAQFGYDSDFFWCGMEPNVDGRLTKGVDEWGCVWDNVGICQLGEVKEFPIKNWADFDWKTAPKLEAKNRFDHMKNISSEAGDKYILGFGVSIYERVHFLRGLENAWTDIYAEPENLCKILDVLVDLNLQTIEKYAEFGVDGYIFCDDWGLQNSLMISPEKWREFWKPRYKKIYDAAHAHNMDTFLHSCGYIVDILDDLIEVGLDVIHMDQQENMGLELLCERFGGKITFFAPVDIQKTMASADVDAIRTYCHEMNRLLATEKGGFIPRWYSDPVGAGHTEEAVRAMCDEFLKIGG